MNYISAQELKRRGIAAMDAVMERGEAYIISRNKPRYVVLTEERYRELTVAEAEAELARVRASLKDLDQGRVRTFKDAKELLKAIRSAGE
jgi:PHD/YefM family antitoxin component YafN of YafNO toxin-antitoxin module